MKRLFLPLLVVSLYVPNASGSCPLMDQCVGNSLNVVTDCCAVCDGIARPATDPSCSPPGTPGVTQDHCAINKALEAVNTAGGGEVYIPPGTCIVSPRGGFTVPAVTPHYFLELYSNTTIRGSGPKSVLQVNANNANYYALFSAASNPLVNVVIKDFRVDQQYDPTILPHPFTILADSATCDCQQYVIESVQVPTTGITVSGMSFDQRIGVDAINLSTDGDLNATITNNYFSFRNGYTTEHPTRYYYDNSAVYLEGSQQVVSGNTFTSTLNYFPIAAIETHGGRSTITNNTSVNYAVLVNVTPTRPDLTPLNPNDIVVANNSATCAQNAITLWPFGPLRNVFVTDNMIQICNHQRALYSVEIQGSGARSPIGPGYTGIGTSQQTGGLENIVIANNTILHEQEAGNSRDYGGWEGNTGGILLLTPGNITNVVMRGNVIKDAPISGIRVHIQQPADQPTVSARRVRISDNIIVDAGRNQAHTQPAPTDLYTALRSAIQLVDTAQDVDIVGNMIYDTTSSDTSTNGLYALNLGQSASSINVRTSQNTVRVNSNAKLRSSLASYGLKDVSNANGALISQVVSGSGTVLPGVDFLSFTQYITTIANTDGRLTVAAPTGDATGTQWTVGQVVTFRFICSAGVQCLVTFAAPYAGFCENAPCGNPPIANMTINDGNRRAITFQVESWSIASATHSFFELYRSPTGVPN